MHNATRSLYLCGVLCVGVFLATACDRLENGAAPAPEEEEEKTAQVTVWGDRLEIFLEHRLLVTGTPTKFITHVTDLLTLEPRRAGPVTFILRQGVQTPIVHEEPAPARDGIYLPELTFPQPGEWMVSLRVPLEGTESVVPLPPFTVFASREETNSAPESVAPEGISFLKEQQWKILTQTQPVTRRALVERLRLAGVVAVRPGNTAAVTPPIAEHLLPPPGASLPSLGTSVKAGQVLAMVQPHVAGTELLTLVSTQQQILALEMELTVKAAEAEAIRARVALGQAERACLAPHPGVARAKRQIRAGAGGSRVRPAQGLSFRVQIAYRKLARAIAAATLLREEILPRAENVLQEAEARYRAGDMSLSELLPVRRDWIRVRLDYLDTLHEVMQAWAELSPYVWQE